MQDADLLAIKKDATARGITRLCHVTQARKLPHILGSLDGIRSTAWLIQHHPDLLDANDPRRLDGCLDHISCSLEYPNTWYLKQASQREPVFTDWVVLLLKPDALWWPETLFSPRNSAANRGTNIMGGHEGFKRLFAERVEGAYNKTYVRKATFLTSCPTDGQAEVLVARHIPLDGIIGIAVYDESAAQIERSRLSQLGRSTRGIQWVISPALFDGSWHSAIVKGYRPSENRIE